MSAAREWRRAYAYIAGILLTTPFVGHMLYSVWTGGGYGLFRAIANAIPIVPQDAAGVQAVAVFGLGLYLTWLALFANDHRKWYQGVLLFLATAVVLAVLWWFGVFIPNIDPTVTNLLWFLTGVVIAVLSESTAVKFELGDRTVDLQGELVDIRLSESSWGAAKTGEAEWAEFPIASRGVLVCIGAVVVVGWVIGIAQAVLAVIVGAPSTSPVVIIGWGIASAVFLNLMGAFVSLETEIDNKQMEVLGPSQSGKTNAMYGLYRGARDASGNTTDLKPNAGIQKLLSDHGAWDGNGWPFDGTDLGEVPEIKFEAIVGERFPSRLSVQAHDHAGENFDDLVDELDGGSGRASNITTVVLPDGGTDDEDVDDESDDDESDDDYPFEASETPPSPEADDESDDDESIPRVPEETELKDGVDSDPNDSLPEDESAVSPADWTASSSESDAPTPEEESRDDEPAKAEDAKEPDLGTSQSIGEQHEELRELGDVDQRSVELDDQQSDGQKTEADDDSSESDEVADEVSDLVDHVKGADKLVLLIDCDRMRGNDPTTGERNEEEARPRLHEYLTILNNVDIDSAVLVASKADLYLDGWKNPTAEPPSESDAALDSFTEYITTTMRESGRQDQVIALMNQAGTSRIHPVYFRTKIQETEGEENRVPDPDDNNNLVTVGYGRVLTAIAQ